MATNSERVTATIPIGIYQYLKKVADEEERPVSSLLNYIIEAWVRNEQEKEQTLTSEHDERLSTMISNISFDLMEIKAKLQRQQEQQPAQFIHL
jgi:CopG-like RHH_1 or ribbon-helix-helix domain, RHH_5